MPIIFKIRFSFLVLLFLLYPHFSNAWFFNISTPQKPFLLMIEASGDSAHPGRTIDDSFESTISFAIAQALKNKLITQNPSIKVILNRAYDERITSPFQNQNFANKLDIDLYISIHVFHETEAKPRIYLYQFSYHDNIIAKTDTLTFYPFDKIYLMNETKTNKLALDLKNNINVSKSINLQGVYKIPFKPLIGIKAPAIGIEIGIKNRSDWSEYIDILADGIAAIIKNK